MTASTALVTVVTRADWVAGPPQGQWTYEDYALLPADGHRYEVIRGVLYMAPAPSFFHQRSNGRFVTHLTNYVVYVAKIGEVLVSPIDVRLSTVANPVQPDVAVVLKEHFDRITPAGIEGAPDLVVEIASPSTAIYDRREKLAAYQEAGVQEYWIADPASQTIEVLWLQNDLYVSQGVFTGNTTLPSQVVKNLPTPVEQFFI